MNSADFRDTAAGRVVRTAEGYDAFVPAPLPPSLIYDDDLVLTFSRADAALSELAGLGRHLPNPHLLIAPYVRREAVLSSRIEGTRTTLAELLLDEATGGAESDRPDDMKEVRNYVAAMEYGVGRLKTLPLSLRLVRELHERLMKGVRGDRATPGEFRRVQNWIGAPGSTPAAAMYVPPPPDQMDEPLNAWERFLHERDRVPDLIQCGLMHEQFEAIHPFIDGNGRVGRLVITLFLIERGRLPQPLLYLSDYIEPDRAAGGASTCRRGRAGGDHGPILGPSLSGPAHSSRDPRGREHALGMVRAFRSRPCAPCQSWRPDGRVLKPEDDVAIAKKEILAGTVLEDAGGRIEVRQDIKPGHKVARRARRIGEAVRRYGQPIGFATADIEVGDHVHTQNVAVGERHQEYEVGTDVQPVAFYPPEQMRYFDGYLREDGRVGTRNYVAVISGVNCSASVSQFVKDKFRDVQKDYPSIDGVLAVTHKSGCGTKLFGEDHMALQRVLAGYAKHPNIAAYILIGLGCEVNQAAVMVDRQRMAAPGHPERKPFVVNIQEAGGIRKTVETAVREVAKLVPLANAAQRTKQPVSEITLATNCGGSDGASGITANPALGWAVDELVRYGGTGVLAETPEIYGAEHLLIRRAINEGVAKKLLDRYKWWEWYCRGIEAMDNNPAPGNKAGGITTVYEKSLGGVTKGGTTPMMDVFQYGEPITTRGFVFMDTPGHDPVSITGLVAGGCNMICFTTGRGSVFGCKPVPSIKLATNSLMYRHMSEDMDINCGVILEGTLLPEVGRQIFEEIVAVASGQRSKSELSGVGEEEFAPWIIGPVM